MAFIAEKDGISERELKACLVEEFKSNIHVREAYLVLVRYGNSPETKVALCLKAGDTPPEEIVKAVGSQFRQMFRTTDSLDIVFLSPEQEHAISVIARPFYEQRAGGAENLH